MLTGNALSAEHAVQRQRGSAAALQPGVQRGPRALLSGGVDLGKVCGDHDPETVPDQIVKY